MPSFCVEYAKSGRSSCKGCKAKIDQGFIRVGTITAGPGDYDMCASLRSGANPKCVPTNRKCYFY